MGWVEWGNSNAINLSLSRSNNNCVLILLFSSSNFFYLSFSFIFIFGRILWLYSFHNQHNSLKYPPFSSLIIYRILKNKYSLILLYLGLMHFYGKRAKSMKNVYFCGLEKWLNFLLFLAPQYIKKVPSNRFFYLSYSA